VQRVAFSVYYRITQIGNVFCGNVSSRSVPRIERGTLAHLDRRLFIDMTSEEELRLKLRKIEALFEGAGTLGERDAAGAALERVKAKLAAASKTEKMLEYKVMLEDQWSRRLFVPCVVDTP
jgi:hypothetical protein